MWQNFTLSTEFETMQILPPQFSKNHLSKLQILLMPHGGVILVEKQIPAMLSRTWMLKDESSEFYPSPKNKEKQRKKGFPLWYQVLMMIIYLCVFLWLYFLGFFLMNHRWLSISNNKISITSEYIVFIFPNKLKTKNPN